MHTPTYMYACTRHPSSPCLFSEWDGTPTEQASGQAVSQSVKSVFVQQRGLIGKVDAVEDDAGRGGNGGPPDYLVMQLINEASTSDMPTYFTQLLTSYVARAPGNSLHRQPGTQKRWGGIGNPSSPDRPRSVLEPLGLRCGGH